MKNEKAYIDRLIDYLPFWSQLTAEQQISLKSGFTVKHYEPDEIVSLKGKQKDGLLIVLEGRLRLFLSAENGREFTLMFVEPHKAFSIVTADNAKPKDAALFLQAAQRTVIGYIPFPTIRAVASDAPIVGWFSFKVAAEEAQDILNCISTQLFGSVKDGVARVLIQQAEREGSDTLHITHEKIANHLGTTREVVSREIKILRSAGYIATGRGKIIILDREGLKKI